MDPHQDLCVYLMASRLVLVGFLSLQMSGSLILMHSFRFFSFCWLALCNSEGIVFVLPYYMLCCYVLFYLLENLFFSNER